MLNRPQQVFEEVEAEVDELDESDERGYEGGGNGGPAHDIGTSDTTSFAPAKRALSEQAPGFPEGIFYGDLRQRGWSEMNSQTAEGFGALPRDPTRWERWDSPSSARLGGGGMH